ncbi:hypothetical protein ACHAWO_003405 [Cyclotella atomus]|jgi:hypothetical protein|uniref:Uncharacterized protein n=1 Tax=Cyclotella atomus TaxID=382360 RepID=A0ABD3MTI2_9STRA
MSVVRGRSVRFSQCEAKVTRIRYPEDLDLNELWYSDEEIGLIYRMVLQDVASCSAMLTDATVDLQDRETFKAHVILCTGLDHLVSTDLPRRVRALEQMKRQHKRTIIAAQRLLRVIDPGEEDLARLSQASSQPRRDRARRVAALAASIEDE